MEEHELSELLNSLKDLTDRIVGYEKMIIELNDEVGKLHKINEYLRGELTKALSWDRLNL